MIVRRTPLKRSTKPIARRRAKPRRTRSPRCVGILGTGRGRCRKPQAHIQRCVPHAKNYLDLLVTKAVVRGRCEIDHAALGIACSGDAQTLHGLDRDELGVRWDLRNIFVGCAAANKWGHIHKRRWYAYVARIRGADVYADLVRLADAVSSGQAKVDYAAVLSGLAP